jgi:hypothetical protein
MMMTRRGEASPVVSLRSRLSSAFFARLRSNFTRWFEVFVHIRLAEDIDGERRESGWVGWKRCWWRG